MIKLTHAEDDSLFLINELQIESIIDTANGTMIQIIGKQSTCFVVKESIEEIEDMLLRDKFASDAMNGFIREDEFPLETAKHIALYSYDMADEMLKQRKEK